MARNLGVKGNRLGSPICKRVRQKSLPTASVEHECRWPRQSAMPVSLDFTGIPTKRCTVIAYCTVVAALDEPDRDLYRAEC